MEKTPEYLRQEDRLRDQEMGLEECRQGERKKIMNEFTHNFQHLVIETSNTSFQIIK